MLVEFGRANLLQKARQQPEKVKEVLDKIRTTGLLPTLETVFNRLDEPLPLGYCNVGEVVEVGKGVTEFKVGDRVASNGQHAEYVCVPKNLVARIPDGVSDDGAAFTVIGSIALQGIRLCKPELGETVVVVGLGLVGLIAAELLVANGCRVIGVDLDPRKVELARSKGVIGFNPKEGGDLEQFVRRETVGLGADAVVIAASAKGNDIIAQAARMSRKRGRIILIGVVGLDLNRADFYDKELTFQVSCSYGPGRYDEDYEQRGIDYPAGFVRWTEKRNFEAVLEAIASKRLKVEELITERVPLAEYLKIYGDMRRADSIASILEYSGEAERLSSITVQPRKGVQLQSGPNGTGIGIIGAGNFAKMSLLPALKSAGANVVSIASSRGLSGTSLAKKFGIAKSTTDYREMLSDPAVSLIIVTTRHDQHARLALECMEAGKHVFVEKPLALNNEQLDAIVVAYTGKTGVTVGFNRRFSPHVVRLREQVGSAPMSIVATMNAGFIPPEAWHHDLEVGGGRIIGEACHFIDLAAFLSRSPVRAVCMMALGENPDERTDTASILLHFANGSTATVNYLANGSKSYAKERIEVFSQGRTAVIDNFRVTTGYGFKGFKKLKTRIDKGHRAQFVTLINGMASGEVETTPFAEAVNATRASFAAVQSLKEGKVVQIDA